MSDMQNIPQYMEDETRPLEGVGMPRNRHEGASHHLVAAPISWNGVIVLISVVGLGIMLYKGDVTC